MEFVAAHARGRLSLTVVGVLRDARGAFFVLCINAGKAVAAAMAIGRSRTPAPQVQERPLPAAT